MNHEKEKMLSGKPYQAFDEQLFSERQLAKDLIFRINRLHPHQVSERNAIFSSLLGATGSHFHIEPPFYCDYGYNIVIGENFYANYNCTLLDCGLITFGDHVMLGPNVALFAAGHPLHYQPRDAGYEYAFPIEIGHSVWIGGNTVVNAGVSIGDRSVIGSGSVVTKDLPANVLAAGNPCKVLRPITDEDQQYYYRQLKF